MDINTQIIKYETGELNEEETTKMFAELIKNGIAWHLQGHYGRTATAYISAGIIDREGNIL